MVSNYEVCKQAISQLPQNELIEYAAMNGLLFDLVRESLVALGLDLAFARSVVAIRDEIGFSADHFNNYRNTLEKIKKIRDLIESRSNPGTPAPSNN